MSLHFDRDSGYIYRDLPPLDCSFGFVACLRARFGDRSHSVIQRWWSVRSPDTSGAGSQFNTGGVGDTYAYMKNSNGAFPSSYTAKRGVVVEDDRWYTVMWSSSDGEDDWHVRINGELQTSWTEEYTMVNAGTVGVVDKLSIACQDGQTRELMGTIHDFAFWGNSPPMPSDTEAWRIHSGMGMERGMGRKPDYHLDFREGNPVERISGIYPEDRTATQPAFQPYRNRSMAEQYWLRSMAQPVWPSNVVAVAAATDTPVDLPAAGLTLQPQAPTSLRGLIVNLPAA